MEQSPSTAVTFSPHSRIRSPHDGQDGQDGGGRLEDGLALLDSFRPGEDWLPLSEISRRASLAKPAARSLVGELVERGYLERGQQGVRLGRHLFVMGLRASGPGLLRGVARPALEDLVAATGAAAFLSVLDGCDVVHVDSVHTPGRAANASVAGERQAVCTAAVTKVLLPRTDSAAAGAAASAGPLFAAPPALDHPGTDGQRARTGPGGAPADTAGTRPDEPVVLSSRQLLGVCAPVADAGGAPLAALTVVGPAHGTRQSATVRHVRAAAATVARAVQAGGH